MKKLLSLLVVLAMLVSALPCNADDTEYIPKGLKATQEQYADLISAAIEKSEYEEEQIDKEHIYIVEHTSPIPMRKNEEAIWIYVALPIAGSSDVSYAHFDNGEYVMAITNFTALKGIENPYGEKLQNYIDKNCLSEPTEITNVWVGERVHVFAYKVNCNNKEYIIPYYFTEETLFNLTKDEECNIEIGKAYTMDDFLTICEKEAELFAEYRKSERQQEKEDESYTYVDNDGEVVDSRPEKEQEDTETDNVKDDEKLGDGDPARVYDFEELTGLSREDIDHIVIRNGADGIAYSTSYDKIISEIYTAINTKSYNVHIGDGDGWSYEISFVDKNNSAFTYTIPTGITVKAKDGLTYRTSNEEELKKVIEKSYNLIANDCSDWAADYIAQAKDLELLEDVAELSYKEPITREKFCEIIYNMYSKSIDNPKSWNINMKMIFEDCHNEKVAILYLEEIINGKGDKIFAPDDYLTREEAATILIRYVNKFIPMPVTEMYFEYDDINNVSEWASDSVQIISNLGVMEGVGDNRFAPKDTYTAEQAITTVIRLYNIK